MKEELKIKYANLADTLEEVSRLLDTSADLVDSICSKTQDGLVINNEGYETNNVKKVLKDVNDSNKNINNIVNYIKRKI